MMMMILLVNKFLMAVIMDTGYIMCTTGSRDQITLLWIWRRSQVMPWFWACPHWDLHPSSPSCHQIWVSSVSSATILLSSLINLHPFFPSSITKSRSVQVAKTPQNTPKKSSLIIIIILNPNGRWRVDFVLLFFLGVHYTGGVLFLFLSGESLGFHTPDKSVFNPLTDILWSKPLGFHTLDKSVLNPLRDTLGSSWVFILLIDLFVTHSQAHSWVPRFSYFFKDQKLRGLVIWMELHYIIIWE